MCHTLCLAVIALFALSEFDIIKSVDGAYIAEDSQFLKEENNENDKREADCGDLSFIENGAVTSAGTSFGQVATYSCDFGHTLTGLATRVCQSNGQWSGSKPLCTPRDCGELSVPSNGRIDLSSGTTYGNIATFTCNLMYELVGSVSAVCHADGTWSALVQHVFL